MAKPEVLAIIPARGGSQGIPGKNIKMLGNFPLITYSIAAAQNSKFVTRTIISTDSEEIANVAKDFGAEVPFYRPAEISGNDARDYPLFEHALNYLKEHENYQPEIVVQLRPTAPFRNPEMVDNAIEIMLKNPKADCVRTVIKAQQNPFKMWTLDNDGQMTPLIETKYHEAYNMPRQELPTSYWQTAHIDVIRRSTIIDKKSLSGNIIFPLFVDPAYAIDIDNLYDWQKAEYFLKNNPLPIITPSKTL